MKSTVEINAIIEQSVAELVEWAARVVEGLDEPSAKRKPYTRTKPIRRGYKRGPYKKRAAAGVGAEGGAGHDRQKLAEKTGRASDRMTEARRGTGA